jgi:hypothetical protein
MFSVDRRARRLFEARVFELTDLAAVDRYATAFAAAADVPRPVLCADHRPVKIYAPPVADALVKLFRTLNARWHRVAILVARTNATLAMQLQRIVRESANPSRSVFYEADDATKFLDPELDAAERERLRAFLSEPLTRQRSSSAPS